MNMPSYILEYVKARKTVLICSAVAAVFFIIGILIGYFSDEGSNNPIPATPSYSLADAIRSECSKPADQSATWNMYFDRYLERHTKKHMCVNSPEQCWDFDLPRHYISYHLNGKSINIDGKLDDQAWNEVPWSELFVDMRSVVYTKPYLETKFKIRWDDDRLYVGAYIQETNLWGTYDKHDSEIWMENGFEMLMDVDGTMFNYKQIQINVLGTMMDQILYKSPWDAPGVNVKSKIWHAEPIKAVHYEGTLNTPGDDDKFWSAEMSFSFKQLSSNSTRVNYKPDENEVWFMQFGRSEQRLNYKDGKYENNAEYTDWWSWQPCDAINLQLQDRWGLVQFKKHLNDKEFRFKNWHMYKSLFDMMDAMEKYKATNGKYITAIEELDVPPYLLSRACVDVPEIKLLKRDEKQPDDSYKTIKDFVVTVKSMLDSRTRASIRSDRYVRFL